MKIIFKLCFFFAVSQLISGCTQEFQDEANTSKQFKIVVLPDRDPELLKNKYQGLADYLKKETGLNCQIIVPRDYAHGLEMFVNKEVEMAFFGGYTFVKAHNQVQAIPLVSRDADTKFKSVVLVRTDNNSQNLMDLKGARFSFGSRLSTSGHLMPRRFLHDMNLIPETFFSAVEYSGAHDKTARWVVEGKVDAGVANAQVINNMLDDGRLDSEKVRILWRSPNYQDYVWAVQSYLNKKTLNNIRDAFLNLSVDNPKSKVILDELDATYYVPVGLNQFDLLINSVAELKM